MKKRVQFNTEHLTEIHLIDKELPPDAHLSEGYEPSHAHDPQSDKSWRIIPFAPIPLQNGIARHSLNQIVYKEQRGIVVYGGLCGVDPMDAQKRYPFQNNVYFMSAKDKKWSILCQIPDRFFRYEHAAVVTKNHRYLIIFGGMGHDNLPHNDTIVFDFETKNVNILNVSGTVPTARVKHCIGMVGNNLILMGGQDVVTKSHLNDMHALNLETKVWTTVNSQSETNTPFTPLPRSSFSLTPLSSTRFLIFGGLNADSVLIDSWIVKFDQDAAIWKKCEISSDEIPPIFGHTSHLIGSNVFIIGGCASQHGRELSKKIYELQLEKDFSVKVLGVNCEHVRMYHASEIVGNEVIVIGGRLGALGTESYTNTGFVMQHQNI